MIFLHMIIKHTHTKKQSEQQVVVTAAVSHWRAQRNLLFGAQRPTIRTHRYCMRSGGFGISLTARAPIQRAAGYIRGGLRGRHHKGPNYFNFIGFSENIIKIMGWRPPQELAPPPRRSSGSTPVYFGNFC